MTTIMAVTGTGRRRGQGRGEGGLAVYAIIVGGGKIGYSLTRTLLRQRL
ncbi:MAG: hypothetical protein ACYC9Q_00355 [Bacillota bacterium]